MKLKELQSIAEDDVKSLNQLGRFTRDFSYPATVLKLMGLLREAQKTMEWALDYSIAPNPAAEMRAVLAKLEGDL